jgi:Cof subfamily protein (haloacid dehalogenase superfamily)
MKIIFVDLDGTLLNSEGKISEKTLECMHRVSNKNIKLAAVTGRHFFSAKRAVNDSVPFDYLICSTGNAIIDFKTKEFLTSHSISKEDTLKIVNYLKINNYNYFIQHKLPDNHYFYYNFPNYDSDFEHRLQIYQDFALPLPEKLNGFTASQFIIVIPNNMEIFNDLNKKIENLVPHLSIVRATSPLNHSQIWFEIYPVNVNKGFAVKELCKLLNVPVSETIAVGNDYNDIDMLDSVGRAFVVANAPDYIKEKYEVVASNDEDGFLEVVDKLNILNK